MKDETEWLPIKKGDNFMLGPYHFVCMEWENGRVRSARYVPHVGVIMHSISVDVFLLPGFRMLSRANEETTTNPA